MRAKRGWAIPAVLPVLGVAACSFGGLDGVTGGGKDAGGAATFDGKTPGSEAGVATDGGVTDAESDAGQTYGDLIRADKPVAYFPFDDPPGTATALEAITGDEGAVNGNGFTFGVPGIAGTALKSDMNPYLDFGQILTFTGEQAWSFEAWIFPVVQQGNEFYEYFNKRDGTTNGIVIYVRLNDDQSVTAQLEEDWHNGGRGVDIQLPALDHFIHIVFTYLPGTGVRPWADGVKGDLGYDAPGGPTATSTSCKVADGVDGTIDEMAVYDYALSDDQIAAHYAKGRPR